MNAVVRMRSGGGAHKGGVLIWMESVMSPAPHPRALPVTWCAPWRAARVLTLVPVLLLGAAGGLARAGEALAQGLTLQPQRIEAILASQGLVRVSDLRRRGGVLIGEASERNGRRVRIVVDAETGEVSGLRPLSGPALTRPLLGWTTPD